MSIYDGIDPSDLQDRLTEAQDAYHLLAIGGQTQSVKMGDKAVSFTAADLDKLARYIRELQGALGLVTPVRGVYIRGGKGV